MSDQILCECGKPATQKAKTETVLLESSELFKAGEVFNRARGPELCDGCARDYVHGRKRG